MTYTLIPLKVLCLLTIFCLYGSLSYASVNSKPFVVPELKQWTGKDGNFTPGTNAKIVCTSANPELLRIAQMFADDYQQMFGKTLSVTQGKATPVQSPNQKIPDRKTKCVIKTHINIKQNVIFGAKLKPV